jgi:CRISPR-associated protein Cas6
MFQGDPQARGHTIDVAFPLRGDVIPLDHGYTLYAALSRLPPAGAWLHAAERLAILPVGGRCIGTGLLELTAGSRLRLRLDAADLPRILPLAGKTLEIAGHRLELGFPRPSLLTPAVALHAHRVTTRNGQDEARFDDEIRRQLDTLAVRGKATRGRRRVLRIKDKTVVAHALLVSGLTADESLRLQEAGLGGRRKMGCGAFVPWRG